MPERHLVQMEMLRDEVQPEATTIRVVLDNRSTHALGSPFATDPPEEAWRLARRLEPHFTPEHASGPNMAECELSVPARQGPDRRLSSRAAAAVGPWAEARDRAGVRLEWSFRVADARRKPARLYPQPSER
jgi:hypothetical protein